MANALKKSFNYITITNTFNFNAENLLENIESQDETSEEISDKDIYNLVMETDNTIDDIDEEPVSEQQQEITGKEAKHLLNRLYSFFEQRDNLDRTFLNYLNRIDDKIDDLYSHHKIVQSTLYYTKLHKIVQSTLYIVHCTLHKIVQSTLDSYIKQ